MTNICKSPFDLTIDLLMENNFKVIVENYFNYRFVKFNDTIDRIDCFSKWSMCPLIVEIPKNKNEFKNLLKYFEFLKTDEGFQYSNNYEFINKKLIPKLL